MYSILKGWLNNVLSGNQISQQNWESQCQPCTDHEMYNSTQQQVFMMIAGVEFYVLSLATQQFLHDMIPEYNDMIYDNYKFLI